MNGLCLGSCVLRKRGVVSKRVGLVCGFIIRVSSEYDAFMLVMSLNHSLSFGRFEVVDVQLKGAEANFDVVIFLMVLPLSLVFLSSSKSSDIMDQGYCLAVETKSGTCKYLR